MVESVFDVRVVGVVSVYVCGVLLLHEVADHEGSVGDIVLRIYGDNIICVLCVDRDDRVLCLLLVRTRDLRIREDRLDGESLVVLKVNVKDLGRKC